MKSLDLLVNQLAIANLMNTDANKEFEKAFAVGPSVQIKKPQRFIPTVGLGYQPQPIDRKTTTVNINPPYGVHFDWDSYERAVNMERGEAAITAEYLEPAMAALAQQIESAAAQFIYQNTNNIVGILGTDPTTFDATSAAARQRMIELGCPSTGERGMFVPPSVMRALKGGSIAYFNPVKDLEKQWRTGIVGSGDSFEWYESVSLYSHTAGTSTSPTVTTGSAQGDATLAVTCTTGDTFLQGDVYTIGSTNQVNTSTRRKLNTVLKQFVVTASVTAVASAATLAISPPIYGPGSPYQNVDALPLAGAALVLFPGTASPNAKTGVNGLAFHKDAFALVSIPLEVPTKAEMAVQKRDPQTGINVRFTRTWDAVNSRMINRFDCLIGFGNLYGDECAVRILGA